jgi:hypothetical protein
VDLKNWSISTLATELTLVGSDKSLEFQEYLQSDDPCFGEHYAKRAEECKNCTAPVIVNGRLVLLNELCEARTKGADDPLQLKRLTSQDVLDRLQSGASILDIFDEILADNDLDDAAVQARSILAARLRYLQKEYDLPVPSAPKTKELKQEMREDE